ncbi:MAG TPA: IS110 family transposase [Salinimicrobium catena]|uniref:IS110 family transposase n=1 Tax=Salinimicrobium catena TaxID=390640 RepID=A0A7C2M647_9FLAO|nr:IS110 family transposase [Salinimicrobium catena]
MKRLSGGIDIGSEHHHIIIINDEEKILYDQKIPHKFSEFYQITKAFREIEKREEGTISFAIEGKNGYGAPFDRILIEEGFTLYNIDNLKLKRFRNVFGAEWRNDQRDAKMLAKLLKLRNYLDVENEKAFIAVEKTPEANEKLKILSRHQQVLINEKIRIQNRLGKRLLEVCPEILELGDTDSKKILRLLIKHPDLSRYKKLTLKSLLKIKMIGKKQASLILETLRNLQYVEELADIYKTIISSYARRTLQLKEEIAMLDKKMEEIGKKSSEVKRLKTISGVGTKLASRLAGEIGDINRFKNERQLAVYCGVACIDDESGKKKRAKAVYKANKICKATMIEMAGCTIRYVQESRSYYAKKRAEGKEHNHALRCLARQLIKVIFKMLTDDRDYILRDEFKRAA